MKFGPKVENLELDMIAWYCTTRTPMTTSMIAWYCTMRTPMTTRPFTLTSTLSERSAHCSVSSSVLARHISCTRIVAQVMSLSHHPHVHVHVSVSPRLALPFLFPALPAALLPLLPALEVRRLLPAAHSAQRGYGLV